MEKIFAPLSAEEYSNLKDAIPLIAVLIAGSDGRIDPKEKSWSEKVTKFRANKLDTILHGFYEEISSVYVDKFENLVLDLPSELEKREAIIEQRLVALNPLLAKLENRNVAFKLYRSFLTFAEHVAKSSGGVLMWGSIGPRERRFMQLSMIDPVSDPFG